MTDTKPTASNDNSSLSVPIHHSKNLFVNYSHLPPTPSSSSSVSSYIDNTHGKARDLPLKIPGSQQKYGSLSTSTPYLESLGTIERPLTPSQTTISPNDDDEGLYLLWTQQLLREKGFTPSSCRPDLEDYMEKQDNTPSSSTSLEDDNGCDDDSSVSDMSFSSDDDMEDGEDDDNDRYIAEQRKLLLNSPAPSAFRSHQPSLISRYSTNNYAAEVTEDDHRNADAGLDASGQSSIYSIFKYLFPCF
ncbi:hypothetical protein BD408DRAFT_412368 [Parasitella parasitica]|nr:hypothetical protein BD408DRAFT_412368 [Parasitella parasitica]